MLTFRSPQSRFWLFMGILLVFMTWLLRPMLLPFVAAFAIAYFLNPLVNWMTRHRLGRGGSTGLILLSFLTCVVLVLVLIVPIIQSQIADFINALPGYINSFKQQVIPWAERLATRIAPNGAEQLQTAAQQYAGDAVGWVGGLLQQVISSSMAILDLLALFVVTPIVAFYLLRDWPHITDTIDKLIPRQHYESIRQQLYDIDKAMAGFIRGQALVCIALGIMYSVGLSLTGLDYGATVGIIAGILSFIPYVGTAFGLVVSFVLALLQFDDLTSIGLVLSVFAVGQFIESYFLTPKLVGDRVGLHPVWIMFALFAGGTLMGFVGILIAVPVAAALGVFVRHSVRKYRESALYDASWPAAANPPEPLP